MVDSTFATPVLLKPFQFGATFVVHSSSKFLAGHSDLTCNATIPTCSNKPNSSLTENGEKENENTTLATNL